MSPQYALAVSIGPVSHFIAAGKSSRDLWFGSTWLSETTRRVAEHLAAHPGVTLMVPTRARLDDIRRLAEAADFAHGGRVSNKVLARVRPEGAPEEHPETLRSLARDLRRVAQTYLVESLDRVRAAHRDWLDLARFDAQRRAIEGGDFVEFSAAWAPVAGDDFGHAAARAVSLRGTTVRGFTAAPSKEGGERSDLDLGRDDVLLATSDPTVKDARRRRGIGPHDRLDAISVTRRLHTFLPAREGGPTLDPLPFVPTTRVSVDAWLEGVSKHRVGENVLTDLDAAMKAHAPSGWGTPSRPLGEAHFPFEASVLMEGGVEALEVEFPEDIPFLRDNIRPKIRRLHAECGVPVTYYAFVEMDGDGIGARLRETDTEKYQALVAQLDRFADDVEPSITSRLGTAIYVAGDELCFYLPVDRALEVVGEITASFQDLVGETMSTGLVIAHAKDDLRSVRRAAREALRSAKRSRLEGRAQLHVTELPRSGPAREVRGPLDELRTAFETWEAALVTGEVSLRTEQLLLEHAGRFEGLDQGLALLRQRVIDQGSRSDKKSGALQRRLDRLQMWSQVTGLANELRIAARIVDVRAQRGAS